MGRQKEDDVYPPLPLLRDEEVIQVQPDQRGITERYVEESVRFIRENKEKPFFLYFAHMHVHLPHYPPARFVAESENGVYGAAVAAIDWAADVLFDELQSLGLDDTTLVIFTSDNGSRARDEGGSNAPLRSTKGTTWEGGQRVPCIMRWPGVIPAGTECNELALSMDLHPTLAAITGATLPSDRTIDGKDIRPLMQAEKDAESPHESFFYYKRNSIEAVRSGQWKLHIRKDAEEMQQLYNLESDIGETENLYEQHPEIVADLQTKIDACRRELGDDATGISGANVRPIGRVENPDTLTHYDPEHPYMIALYDLKERG